MNPAAAIRRTDPAARDWRRVLRMSLRALRRDIQAGELRVLALALLIAVASVAAVGLFTDRIQLAMERKASELLGADLVARSALHAGELPIGVITASVGAPLFIYLLLRQDADVSR
jgi:ABC-type Fe3+-siderophore transport system permease subunit